MIFFFFLNILLHIFFNLCQSFMLLYLYTFHNLQESHTSILTISSLDKSVLCFCQPTETTIEYRNTRFVCRLRLLYNINDCLALNWSTGIVVIIFDQRWPSWKQLGKTNDLNKKKTLIDTHTHAI